MFIYSQVIHRDQSYLYICPISANEIINYNECQNYMHAKNQKENMQFFFVLFFIDFQLFFCSVS